MDIIKIVERQGPCSSTDLIASLTTGGGQRRQGTPAKSDALRFIWRCCLPEIVAENDILPLDHLTALIN